MTLLIAAGNIHIGQLRFFFAALHSSMNDYKGTASIDLGVRSKFKGVGEFASTQSANNEDQLYLPQPLTNFSIRFKGYF